MFADDSPARLFANFAAPTLEFIRPRAKTDLRGYKIIDLVWVAEDVREIQVVFVNRSNQRKCVFSVAFLK